MDHPKPNLRIVEAKDMEPFAGFDHTPVTSSTGDNLGSVDGFVVDTTSGDPCYVVVDAGGWFKSKFFLLPMDKAHLDNAEAGVTADLSKEDVNEFPGFDKSEFKELQ